MKIHSSHENPLIAPLFYRRDELAKSNQKVADFQRQLHEKQQENQTLNEARNVALQQIATLKKHASQLQNFKKNISTMLQVRSISAQLLNGT